MVALAIDRIDRTPPLDLSGALLAEAHQYVEAKDQAAAACCIREGLRRHLLALCEWFGCLPEKRKRTNRELVRAVEKTGHIGKCFAGWLDEIFDSCNRVVHCETRAPVSMACCLSITYSLVDSAPWARWDLRTPPKPPACDDDDLDDDDPADWWKGGDA